jgi:prepilin-type N-terminal cleavage/methylation domain-containing protein/prepilin-type processing-associated H-X9-DG protein
MKKAFTLIELLVVIAIIAILAAILFPVFAQAKLAAKKTASLSNVKQLALAEIMYQGDNDDYFVLLMNGHYSDRACGYSGATGTNCADNLPLAQHTQFWTELITPYVKTFQMFVDPAVGDGQGYYGSGSLAIWYNQYRYAQYGYNYQFLSPWNACDVALARSGSSGINPASTVLLSTSEYWPDITANGRGWLGATPPGTGPLITPAPNACTWYDGKGWSTGWFMNGTASDFPTGHYTSTSRASKPYGGANLAWVDGHAKFFNESAAAAGTDYSSSSAASHGGYGAIITDFSKYLWSLDGTKNDLIF